MSASVSYMQKLSNLADARPMTLEEAAAYLSVTPRTVSRWIADAGLPVHRVGPGPRATQRFYVEELDAWLRSRCFDTAGDTAAVEAVRRAAS